MKTRFASILAVASLAWLLAACSGGGDADNNASAKVELPRPTPKLAGTAEVGDQSSQTGTAVAAKASAETRFLAKATSASASGNTLGPISTSDPQTILGAGRAVANPSNPRNLAALKLVTLPDGVRNRLPTGKWSKGFFYQSPLNLDAYFQPNPATPDDPRNQGGDISQFSIFAFPNKLNLDDRLGMVAVSFPARRYIAYALDPNAAVYDLRNPYRADTLLYHIAPNSSQDIRLSYVQPGPSRLTRKIDQFDELTISTSWSNAAGGQRMQVVAAEGSPYVTLRYAGLRPVVQIGQGSLARSEKAANGLPDPTKPLNYAQQESDNAIQAVAVGEEPLQQFIENNNIRTTPALTGSKFRFIYQLPDRARAAPGTNDNRPVTPLQSYKELVVYTSSPITLEWDTPSRSYVARDNFTGVVRTAFIDDVPQETWQDPVTRISDIPSFKERRAILDRYANTFPVSSEIFLEYDDNATGLVKYKWAMETMNGQAAQGSDLLMMGFDATHIPALQNASKVAGLSYRSNFGMMSAIEGNQWSQALTIPDILRNGATGKALWMGNGDLKSEADTSRLLQSLKNDTSLLTENFLSTCNADSYICGKYLHNVARLALIADYLGRQGLAVDVERAKLLAYLKRTLSLWLDGVNPNGQPVNPNTNTVDDSFIYDTTNGGLITSLGLLNPEKDYSNREYIDHMFHYGYYIYAASVVAVLDPQSGWLQQNREKVNLLVRDIANPSLDDRYFPIVRTFDWFRMQNIADAGPDANGGNTESSSESINSNYALLTWGVANGDNAFQALAAIMTAAEIRTAQAFYQVTPKTPYLQNPDFAEVPGLTVQLPDRTDTRSIKPGNELVMNILRADIAETNTFFGPLLVNRVGINLLPISPISEFVISAEWASAHAQSLRDLETNSTGLFDRIINNPPNENADCVSASWDKNNPPKNPDGSPQELNPGAVCAGQLRTLYSWRQLIIATNALNDPDGAYRRYTGIIDNLNAQQQTYRDNTDPAKHPGSSRNSGGIVADVLKDTSTPSTDTNTLWWLMTRKRS